MEQAEKASRPARNAAGVLLSVILPVREEAEVLEQCLRALTAQSEPGWLLGEQWELLVINDGSADGTATAARNASVTLLEAQALPEGWTGKSNACRLGAERAKGQWLLFTSARAIHRPGSLSRGLVEADRHGVKLLSYEGAYAAGGLMERALLPLILSELRSAYPFARVNDPDRRIGYASSEFLLVEATAYRAADGHAAASLTPEVDLAFALKRGKAGLRARSAPEMVEVVPEAGFAFREGWQRKLALLIHNALPLAAWRVLDVLLVWGLLFLALLYPVPLPWERAVLFVLWLRTLWRIYQRAARSGMAAADIAVGIVLGLPFFAVLLCSSWYWVRMLGRVRWKGREYRVPDGHRAHAGIKENHGK